MATPYQIVDLADPASETPILTIPHPGFTNHNGGDLAFDDEEMSSQHAALEFSGHLANHVDGLGLERPEV